VLLEVASRLSLSGLPQSADFLEYVQARTEALARAAPSPADLAASRRAALQRGGYYLDAPPPAVAPALRLAAAERFVTLPAAPSRAEGEVDLVVFPTALRGDGRNADLPWLQEIPDALSSVSWSRWADLSPGLAARLGVATGDLLTIRTSHGKAELPAYVFPGIRDDAVGLPLGPEALAVLPPAHDPSSGSLAFSGTAAAVFRAGKRASLPLLEGSPYQHGRNIVPTVSASAPAPKRPDLSHEMYDGPKHPEHRWAMAIDLDRCTGCQACVVACFAENNVPVMGSEAAMLGRYMGWLRIERYLGDEPGGTLDVRLLPMMCQQCASAPCEPVCPVYATYHTAEGLNAQIYNRCVGTRYCANNCPYKVRTFNWRDAQFPKPLNMQLNPDVTVRSRGVAEKCTFCVQRIRAAENDARDAGRPVADGEILPACAQTCAAQAIVFGDANDAASRVSRLSADPRAFRALEEVNTKPAVTYLAAVRERDEP
jgi:molybdopterin-containing oxidoreductase family iron-sulfur binding subunit